MNEPPNPTIPIEDVLYVLSRLDEASRALRDNPFRFYDALKAVSEADSKMVALESNWRTGEKPKVG